MSTKRNLRKFHNLVAGDMSAASVTSAVTNVQRLDNIGIQVNWAGATPIGVLTVEVSADYEQDEFGNVLVTGNWNAITLSPTAAISGNTGSIYIDIAEISAPWMRIKYTKTSGTGTIEGYITGKSLG